MKSKHADKKKRVVIIVLVIILSAFLIFFVYNRGDAPARSDKTESVSAEVSSEPDTVNSWYMVNDKTMEFHRLSCSRVEGISKDSRCVSADKEMLKKEGYTPCKECNP